MDNKEFFTFREYMKKDEQMLTASMEDYLEMIYRLSFNSGYTRTHNLAAALNVQPSSTTKMMKKLSEVGLVDYEKYGIITLSNKGKEFGKALLKRHMIIEEFLQLLGVTEDILEETEKIEHTISDNTLECIANFVEFVKYKPETAKELKDFAKEKNAKKKIG
ncbi:MAG: Transcriptional regulator MntR [Pelotomaculum sp. PtaB.Bin013]|uniref:Manganese transport regulator n=1 Tax=Pelotomaculum isophthalicicum JI TaxID=947010 RepID=A0A9X4H4G2_9FIRM|nr:transcriptional regulator MntR [Pelotomaculum isophthalicicum]MDF9408733.1 transcriptional regulator MntR [Pelotomaculum isophthalicicum JI]OPX81673.1 MAG: Transcriptional regulator MntR [Pelotomaculum sp. PtaB.Bin013]